jgi:signal peptidase II
MGASASARRPLRFFIAVAAMTLTFDQLTKALVLRHIADGTSVPVVGKWLFLTVTTNTGSAFSLFQNQGTVLLAAGIGICAAILGLVALRPDLQCCYMLPLALIWGGSLGNLLDRLRRSAVVDFIDLRFWPVFNVSDVAITVGFAILTYQLVVRRQ